MHKKTTRTLGVLTALAMLLSAAACGVRQPEESLLSAPEENASETPAPVLAEHTHDWQHGVCRSCGERCGHVWEDGVCTICEENCEHVWEDGVCRSCGVSCTHHWDSGTCRICGMACPHEHHDPNTGLCTACLMPVGHSYINLVCTRCGEGPAFVETTKEYPADAAAPTDRKGKLETYHLPRTGGGIVSGARDPEAYEDRQMLDFVVYTPFGYEPAERYNVLILTPGAGHNAHYWLERANRVSSAFGRVRGADLLDSLIAGGYIEPLIVVAVEYYLHDGPEQSAVYFEQNLRWFILPFLAENYATYATVDEYGILVPSPEHFALVGASYGAMIGWQILPDCADLFSYWGLLSGAFKHNEEMIARINAGVGEETPIRMLYAGDGKLAPGYSAYRNRIKQVTKECACFEEGNNIIFLLAENTEHGFSTWNMGLYNCLQIFFRNEFVPGTEPAAEDAETVPPVSPEPSPSP